MPVEVIAQPRCAVCGRIKGQLNKWILARVVDGEFSYRSYDAELLRDYDWALCGLEHLDSKSREFAQKLIGMRNAGEG